MQVESKVPFPVFPPHWFTLQKPFWQVVSRLAQSLVAMQGASHTWPPAATSWVQAREHPQSRSL